PTLSYVGLNPAFAFDEKAQQFKGGLFWDGRAPDLESQAGEPILNPIEMALPDKESLVDRVGQNPLYRERFEKLYGTDFFDNSEKAFMRITAAIAAFERTSFFSPFDSKYDRYLRGEYELTDLEDLGMSIFFSTTNSNCSSCHQLKVMDDEGETFSNYEYHNIGTPTNRALRSINGVALNTRDLGLGGRVPAQGAENEGKFKVPTLRNSAVTGPYMHNGVFRNLRTVIEFYDQYNNPERVNNPETGEPWGVAEIPDTVNREDLKAKKLTDRKIDALIAFLNALTDQRYEGLID
ncbi:MAG: cytochrome c peroxidase, partial [Pseudomonadota bacterium]